MIHITNVLLVSFAQFAIFDSKMAKPFSIWTETHVAQGFAWRPGSASFRTMGQEGKHYVEVIFVDSLGKPDSGAIRVVDVPFVVPMHKSLEIASISEGFTFVGVDGRYLLRCEIMGPKLGYDGAVRLLFSKNGEPQFRIVRPEVGEVLGRDLLTTAQPAE